MVFQSVLVAPVQVEVVLMFVTVASFTAAVSGSLVLGEAVVIPFTKTKLLPDTLPCVLTDLAPGGVFTVAWNVIVTLSPPGSVKPVPLPLTVTVSPLSGVKGLSSEAVTSFEGDNERKCDPFSPSA